VGVIIKLYRAALAFDNSHPKHTSHTPVSDEYLVNYCIERFVHKFSASTENRSSLDYALADAAIENSNQLDRVPIVINMCSSSDSESDGLICLDIDMEESSTTSASHTGSASASSSTSCSGFQTPAASTSSSSASGSSGSDIISPTSKSACKELDFESSSQCHTGMYFGVLFRISVFFMDYSLFSSNCVCTYLSINTYDNR
jgi:hypothetical protein